MVSSVVLRADSHAPARIHPLNSGDDASLLGQPERMHFALSQEDSATFGSLRASQADTN